MDSIFNFTVLALILPIILLILTRSRGKSTRTRIRPVKWPPGPRTLPIIGNMHLLKPQVFRSLAELSKQYGPLMRLKLGEVDTIVVSSPELAREVLKEQDPCYANRPQSIGMEVLWYNYRDIAFAPYGDYWRQMRKICIVELLSPRSVRSIASIRADEVSGLVASLRATAGTPVNASEVIFSSMSSVTCRAVFGAVLKDKQALIRIVKEGLLMAGGFEVEDFFPSSVIIKTFSWTKVRLQSMRRKLDVILDDLIKQHKVNLARIREESGGEGEKGARKGNGEFGNEDIVDVLLRVQETGELQFPIGNDDIKAVVNDMFAAGTETSATAIDWVMVELMRNPKTMAKVQSEVRHLFNDSTILTMADNDQNLKYLKMVIKETLRLHPPVPLLPRESLEERLIGGYIIPAKVKVLVNNWGLQRDPKYWTEPERFKPERFEECSKEFLGSDFDFLAFGAGKRMCPGITFGLASVELILAQLLYHFDWKLPEGVDSESLDMIENPGLTASRRDDLLVVPTPYVKKAT